VLFVFNDSHYSKDLVEWKLGRIVFLGILRLVIMGFSVNIKRFSGFTLDLIHFEEGGLLNTNL